jgi:hypothetical protein
MHQKLSKFAAPLEELHLNPAAFSNVEWRGILVEGEIEGTKT